MAKLFHAVIGRFDISLSSFFLFLSHFSRDFFFVFRCCQAYIHMLRWTRLSSVCTKRTATRTTDGHLISPPAYYNILSMLLSPAYFDRFIDRHTACTLECLSCQHCLLVHYWMGFPCAIFSDINDTRNGRVHCARKMCVKIWVFSVSTELRKYMCIYTHWLCFR